MIPMKEAKKDIIRDLDNNIYSLCELLFGHYSVDEETVGATMNTLYFFIGKYQLLFYYHLAPILNPQHVALYNTKDIVENIYLLRLIKKSIIKEGNIRVERIKRKFKRKFNLCLEK